MFILLRRIERWLHQHVFKVGWLSTHNYQTTTILYYTFFLPGVLLHEVVYYLAAGVFNVRVEREIKWPSEQEIGELKLNFVKLAPRTSPLRKAIISSSPLLVGLICIWLIASEIFDITAVVERMSTGELVDIGAAFNMLISAPLFWLWIYIIFTIANTMFPTAPKDLRGWRSVLIGLAIVGVAMFLVGIGSEIFEVLQAPLGNIILVLTQTFILIICIDLLMVLALGLIEYSIERVTGHSATFRGNRMYTMTRDEAIEEREKERERERKRQERAQRRREADNGITSIYALTFAIPGAPNEETVTELEPLPEPPVIEEKTPPPPPERPQNMPIFGGLAEEQKVEETISDEEQAQREKIASRINLPTRPATIEEKTSPKPVEKSEAVAESPEVVEALESTPEPEARETVSKPVEEELAPAIADDTDEEEPEEEETVADIMRRSRGDDDVSSLFAQLRSDAEGAEEPETPDIPSERGRFGSRFGTLSSTNDTDETRFKRFGTTGSRFGQARPPSPAPPAQENQKSEDDTTQAVDKRFKRPSEIRSRFNQSELTSVEDTDEDTIPDDELVYEDIDDADLYYDDDEEYYEYDDYVDDDVD
ncbi:MAG: hypothetical protein ACFE0Q_17220 [Anaerolineae bacterium]